MTPIKVGTGAVVAALGLSLLTAGCATSTQAPVAGTTASSAASSAAAPATSVDLKALVPAPANVTVTKGPDAIADGGTHTFYQVNGTPNDVMSSFKSALEGKGWNMTTIVSSGNAGGGGGATYTGTHGDAYGVFDGGGYQSNTYIDVCTWPSKPANPNCARGSR